MDIVKTALLAAAALGVAGALAAQNPPPPEPPSEAVVAYAKEFVAANLIGNAALNEAIRASTEAHRRLGYDDAVLLDSQWRVARSGAETEAAAAAALERLAPDTPVADQVKAGEALIQAARENDVSKWLVGLQEAAEPAGAITEIFVMDGWGWNVAQTGGTSDFYQGDEGKWQKTYALADPGIEILNIVEEDGVRSAQISLPITDGGKAIGAVTVGVDVDKVQ